MVKDFDDIYSLILNGDIKESNIIELKAAKGGYPKIYDTLSSFSNQDKGGWIILGVDEKTNSVSGVSDIKAVVVKVSNSCELMEPIVRVTMQECKINELDVLIIRVPGKAVAERPCYYKVEGVEKGSYIRVGDKDKHMTSYEVYNYTSYNKHISNELRVLDRQAMETIDTSFHRDYLNTIRSKSSNFIYLSDDDIDEKLGFKENGIPTLCGIMLFSNYPQAVNPQYCINIAIIPGLDISYSETSSRLLSKYLIEGSIPNMIEESIKFLVSNFKTEIYINPRTGMREDILEYPIIAIREAIINALSHRDYSPYTENSPISIRMYYDRLEIISPGILYGDLTIDEITSNSITKEIRNPFIVKALSNMNYVENAGTGINIMINAMKYYGLPEPEFKIENNSFIVTFYNKNHISSNSYDNSFNEFENNESNAINNIKNNISKLENDIKKLKDLLPNNSQPTCLFG